MKWLTVRWEGRRARSNEAGICHKNFCEKNCLTGYKLSNLTGTYYDKRPLCHNNLDAEGQKAKGQGHTRPEVDLAAWRRHHHSQPFLGRVEFQAVECCYWDGAAGGLKSRGGLSMKLAGSTWGASANTLRSSALALCYSAAEYCAPVWSHSAHTSRIDIQLNSTMRLISGTLLSAPLPWLPVLSNIEPPALRRKAATDKLVEKIIKHDIWPIQPDIRNPPLLQLTSRKPLWLDLQPVDIKSRWRHNWK